MSNKLIIQNCISQLILDSESIHNSIWEALRFRKKGYFHIGSYKLYRRTSGQKGWDGFTEFYSKITGKFPTGILPEVVKALNVLNLKVEIDDQRSPEIDLDHISENIFNDQGITLYDYQVEIVNSIWKSQRGIIKAATASGKTLMFTALVKSIPPKTPALILFRSRGLVRQTYEIFKQNGIENLGRIYSGCFEPNSILLTTIQSKANYLSLLDKFEVLIVDESHEFSTPKSIEFFKKMKKCRYRFGFSATPWPKGDIVRKYQAKSWFGPVLANIETKELQDKGRLSKSDCYFHKIEKPYEIALLDYNSAYQKGVVENPYLHKKINEIIDKYKTGRILIIVEKLPHGEALHALIRNSIWVSGADSDETRDYAIKKLRESAPDEKVVVIASRIMQTGVDVFVHALINAAGYQSDIMTIQRKGRGLRLAPDKEKLDYHDFYYTNNSYLEKHSKERIKHLKAEGHEIQIVN